MRRIITYLYNHYYLEILAILLFILSFLIEPIIGLKEGQGFIFNPIQQVFKGYYEILKSPSILTTDYVFVAGLGATFFNVSTILLFNLLFLQLLKIKMNGPIFSGLIMIAGFSFFGKNIMNTLPIYLGIFLYSLFKKIPFKSFIITILFSTGISPLVSYTMFGFSLHLGISIPLGFFCGFLAGFLIPAFASHTIIFHEGYNLYNTGFALGIISAFFYAIFRFAGWKVEVAHLYDDSSYNVFYWLLLGITLFYIVLAFVHDSKVYEKYGGILKTNGRLISDYGGEFGNAAVFLNFGIISLLLLIVALSFQVKINGVIFGSTLAVIGFTGYGLHLRNVLPIWIGAGLAIFLNMVIKDQYTLTVSQIMMFVFASGVAPIAGRYGIIYGVLIGILHIIFTPIVISLQGGFDLYNNGLSAGFEAALVTVLAEKIFTRRRKHDRKSKGM